MLGGACGDALGAPVEFLKRQEIRAQFGPRGITEFAEAYGIVGAITDDTQMSLFTADGLIRAAVRGAERGIRNPVSVVHHSTGSITGNLLGALCGVNAYRPNGFAMSRPRT